MLAIAELPADNRMNDTRCSPIGEKEIGSDQFLEIICSCFPTRRKICFGSVFEISHIVKNESIAAHLGECRLRDIVLPLPRVAWFQCKPPADKNQKEGEVDTERRPPSGADKKRSTCNDDKEYERSDRIS